MQLPDGRTQRVLVPQLYALVDPNTPTLSAGLISAKGVNINLTDGLFNSGTLAARENLAINAASITNVLGTMQGQNVDLRASGGITSILGQIAARQNLTMKAGGDMVFIGGAIKAGGNLSIVGAQINRKGFSARAGGNYEERAAYDIKERVSVESIERSGPGVYLADFNNNMLALSTLGEHGGKTEKDRTETHIDSTRTAIVTNINAGGGTVSRNVGGDALIEGSVIQGGRVGTRASIGQAPAAARRAPGQRARPGSGKRGFVDGQVGR